MTDRSPYHYPNVLDASRGLLLDVCERLSSLHTNYVIVGGWAPYLRTTHETLHHPGTKDVDVLSNDDRKLLQDAVRALLSAGYLLSAKHPFQLLRTLNVKKGNEHQEFVFNVDLMHPSEAAAQPDMFADILELNIAENYDPKKVLVKSIVFPSSSIIFEERMWDDFKLAATSLKGNDSNADIPLLNEVGSILSKCESATKKKRERDAYDIYFILTADNGADIADKLRLLSRRFPQVRAQLNFLRDFLLKDKGVQFQSNVMRYIPYEQGSTVRPAHDVLRLLFPEEA
jgi:hypothetical protein